MYIGGISYAPPEPRAPAPRAPAPPPLGNRETLVRKHGAWRRVRNLCPLQPLDRSRGPMMHRAHRRATALVLFTYRPLPPPSPPTRAFELRNRLSVGKFYSRRVNSRLPACGSTASWHRSSGRLRNPRCRPLDPWRLHLKHERTTSRIALCSDWSANVVYVTATDVVPATLR
jgi:hypothetical protein